MPLTESSRGTITTILFTDLVNSTDLMRRLGDERALPLFDAAVRQFREIGMAGWLRRVEELRRALLA